MLCRARLCPPPPYLARASPLRRFFADSYDLFVTDGVGNVIKNLGPANSFSTTYHDVNGTAHTYKSYTTFLCYQKSSVCSPYTYQNVTDGAGNVVGGGFAPNPNSVYTSEMLPRYQTQTTFLKNGLNNAASFGNGACARRARAWDELLATQALSASWLGASSEAGSSPLRDCRWLHGSAISYVVAHGVRHSSPAPRPARAVLGQVFFGVMGDLMGRKTNFIITSSLIILGCLGAATASAGFTVGGNIGPDGLWADANALPAASFNDVYGQVRGMGGGT